MTKFDKCLNCGKESLDKEFDAKYEKKCHECGAVYINRLYDMEKRIEALETVTEYLMEGFKKLNNEFEIIKSSYGVPDANYFIHPLKK